MTPSPDSAAGLRFVFVVTYGRSGSTLTQGFLNAMPRTLVRGENNLYVLPLYRSFELLASFKEKFGGPGSAKPSSAFYGLGDADLDAYAASVRELVQRQLLAEVPAADLDRIGFKEVLWHRVKADEQAGFFDFLDLAFDRPLYVLNQRDVAMTTTSGFWRNKAEGVAERQVGRVRKLQAFLRESRPDRTFDQQYERATSSDRAVVDEQLRGLAEFVTGSCDDALLARLRETLEVGHGPNPFGKTRTT